MQFKQLNLSPQIQRAISEFGYSTPSPIQQKAIPPVLSGRDLIGCAQTGTGKTAAFALPMLEILSKGTRAKAGTVRALILTPTRELALQIGQNFTDYGKYTSLRHTVIFGGVGQMPQIAALKKGVDVLIACPGRLNDLTNQGFVNLSKLEIFVLDEADRMLDMGFVHDVKRVVAKLPPKRQNLMFSATMPKEIEELAASFLNRPIKVKVDPVSSTVDRITQSLYYVEKGNKLALLIHLIKQLNITNALVFSRTKHGADKIVKQLVKSGITAAAIHGNKGQNARVLALENFKAGKTKILVATDIAARGIDINELSHVFNFDLPEVAETYVHRIGRTARAGAEGIAIAFCATEEKEYLRGIEKLNRKQIPVVEQHPFAGKPSPVKAIVAPLRGKKTKDEKSASEAKNSKQSKDNNAKKDKIQSNIKKNIKEEDTMRNTKGPHTKKATQNNEKSQENTAQAQVKKVNKPQNNNQHRQGQKAHNDVKNNQKCQENPNKQGKKQVGSNKNNVQKNVAFDPRFLSPMAAEQIPHTAPIPKEDAKPTQLQKRQGNNNNREKANNAVKSSAQAHKKQVANQRQGSAQKQNMQKSGQRQTAHSSTNSDFENARTTYHNKRSEQHANHSTAYGNTHSSAHSRHASYENQHTKKTERTATVAPPSRSGLRTVRSSKPFSSGKGPGLELITRRPPQQKFTSFDDYMSARGGESAPIKGEKED